MIVQLNLSIQILFAGNTGSVMHSNFEALPPAPIVELPRKDFYNTPEFCEEHQQYDPVWLIQLLRFHHGPADNGKITFETNNDPNDLSKGCMRYGAEPKEKLCPLLFALHEDLPEVAYAVATEFPRYIWFSRDSNGNAPIHYYVSSVLRKSRTQPGYPLHYPLINALIINHSNWDYLTPLLMSVSARPDLMVALHLRGAGHYTIPKNFTHHISRVHTLTSLVILKKMNESEIPQEDKVVYAALLPQLRDEINRLIEQESTCVHCDETSCAYSTNFFS